MKRVQKRDAKREESEETSLRTTTRMSKNVCFNDAKSCYSFPLFLLIASRFCTSSCDQNCFFLNIPT